MTNKEKFEKYVEESFLEGLSNNCKFNTAEYDKGVKCIEIFENFAEKLNSLEGNEFYADNVVSVFNIFIADSYEIIVRFSNFETVLCDNTIDYYIEFLKVLKENHIYAEIHKSNSGYVAMDVSFFPMDWTLGVEEF